MRTVMITLITPVVIAVTVHWQIFCLLMIVVDVVVVSSRLVLVVGCRSLVEILTVVGPSVAIAIRDNVTA